MSAIDPRPATEARQVIVIGDTLNSAREVAEQVRQVHGIDAKTATNESTGLLASLAHAWVLLEHATVLDRRWNLYFDDSTVVEVWDVGLPDRRRGPVVSGEPAADRLTSAIRARLGPGESMPTSHQIAVVLHSLADVTALQSAIDLAASDLPLGLARWLHATADQVVSSRGQR